jgi:hypothetical protein
MTFESLSSAVSNYSNSALDPYPTTQTGWRLRYAALRRVYTMAEYGKGEMEIAKLFRALDDDSREIDWTRRVFGVGAFLVNTNARALTGGRLILERPRGGGNAETLRGGERIWRRSEMALQATMAAKMTACLGDYWIEAVRTGARPPYDTTLVCYDPDIVTPEYDTTVPTRLIKVTIDTVDDKNRPYQRVITADGVTVTIDGNVLDKVTGEHRAGTIPMVHLRWMPFGDFAHSMSAMSGLDNVVMRMDSILCQIGAGLTRFGNPSIVVTGAMVSPGDVGRFGRVYHGLPQGASMDYLQLDTSAIVGGLEVVRELLMHIRETRPEFLFANSGAGESGAARSYLAAAFESQIYEVRGHWFDALQRITGIAAAMDAGRQYDEEDDELTIDAPPPLPVDRKAQIEALYLAAGDIRRADRIRSLQALGMMDATVDPEAYAVQVADEESASAVSMLRAPMEQTTTTDSESESKSP